MGFRGWVLGEMDAADQITSRSEGLDERDGPGAIHLRTRKVLPGKGGISPHLTDDPGRSLDPGEHRRRAYAGDAEGLRAFHQHSARLNCGTGNAASTCGACASRTGHSNRGCAEQGRGNRANAHEAPSAPPK